MDGLRVLWRIDPDSGRDLRGFGALADEPLRRAAERGVKRGLSGGIDCVGLPEVDLIGRHQADACVVMVLVIPGCEPAAKGAGLVDGLEPFGELWLILQGLEVGFRERVVIRGMRPAVGFDHAQIGQHQGGRLCLHRGATIGVQRQLVGGHGMFDHGALEQGLELAGTFGVFDPPARDAAAIDVEDDIEIEVRPFHRPHQLGVRRFKLSPGQFDPGRARPRLTPRTRPGWAPRPAVRASDRPDDDAGGGVP